MQTQAKVVIIGGGMMGVGLAYHLAEAGWKDVLLIEKGELTSGSTWHAAGQCPSFIGNYNMAKIHHYGNTLYPKLEAMTGHPTGWHGCGGIRIATTPEEVDWFRHVAGFAANVGFRDGDHRPRPHPRDEPLAATPMASWPGPIPRWTAMSTRPAPATPWRQARGQMGAVIQRHTRVTGINRLPSGEFGWTPNRAMSPANMSSTRRGCYAREVGRWLGVDTPITNMEHQYLVTEPLAEFRDRPVELPVMRDPATAGYYRQEQKAGLVGIYEHTRRTRGLGRARRLAGLVKRE